jgi:hypothetical protein
VLPAPSGGWTFRLDLVKEPPADPPDDDALLAGLSDDRPRAESSTLPTSSTSTGWPRWSGCCDPKADGRSRIRG